MLYREQAKKAYANDEEQVLHRAIAAGTAIDNALKVVYSKGGITHSHFMMGNYLAYFSYEALGANRIKLLWDLKQ